MRDEQIVRMLWDREEKAIEQMQQQYGNYCYSISYHIVSSREDADECLNDTWLATWNTVPDNRPPSLKAYVGKIIRNLSLNRVIFGRASKRGGGRAEAVYEDLEEMLGGIDPIEQLIDRQHFAEKVNLFLDGLNEENRNIFVLRFWYLYTPEEIAEKYDMNIKSVYNALFRLRKKFQIYWKSTITD